LYSGAHPLEDSPIMMHWCCFKFNLRPDRAELFQQLTPAGCIDFTDTAVQNAAIAMR
jgi:hypothetical protein